MTDLPDQADLLELALSCADGALALLMHLDDSKAREILNVEYGGRETKIRADALLDQYLHERLDGSGLSILSEERISEFEEPQGASFWVVDPLDGSLNFLRGIGPSAISIGLWTNGGPALGVIASVASGDISYGGSALGAWTNGSRIGTSQVGEYSGATIATGLPSRVSRANDAQLLDRAATVAPFGKVRMIGSATTSLLRLAQGGLDAYFEDGIMLWDVAAGLALVEGAGGSIQIEDVGKWSYRVWSSNGWLSNPS